MFSRTHIEQHFRGGRTVRDIVFGIADGLTVPFAIAAGLSSMAPSGVIIVAAGLADIVAGAISMGAGGYLVEKGDAEHYLSESQREAEEVREFPSRERQEVRDVFRRYKLKDEEIEPILDSFTRHPEHWVDFMMRFELGLEKPEPGRALTSAATIGGAYIAGGVIPLAPYIIFHSIGSALLVSTIATLTALFIFGYIKGRFTGKRPLVSALQTLLIGGLSAGAAYFLARAVAQWHT